MFVRGASLLPGGQYIAAVMSDTVGTRQIEVLTDAAAGKVVITVFRGVTGDDRCGLMITPLLSAWISLENAPASSTWPVR